MEFKTSIGDLVVDEVGDVEDNWITIESRSVTFDKNDFYIKQFNRDFPDYKLLGTNEQEKFTFLSELCGRTQAMQTWFAATSIQYSETTQLPLYLKNRVAPDVYDTVQENLLLVKDKLAVIIKERNELAIKYKADLKLLEAKERNVVKKTIGDDNLLKIVSLTTASLPLSIQMKIQSYMADSNDLDVSDNRRRYAQEYLAKFKVALIDLNEMNKIPDIDELLNELTLK